MIRTGAAAALLLSQLLGACTPLAVASLAQALVGGGERSAGMSAGGANSPTFQNGRTLDESVTKALDLADNAAVSTLCRQSLPDLPPLTTGQCDTRPICLPGAKSPIVTRVCALPDATPETAPETASETDTNAVAQAENTDRPPAWQWETVQ